MWACHTRFDSFVRWLVTEWHRGTSDAAALITRLDDFGRSCAHYAAGRLEQARSAVHDADDTACLALVVNAGVDVNCPDHDGWTPLHCAVDGGVVGAVSWLLALPHIAVDARTNDGDTAAMLAAMSKHPRAREMQALLAARGGRVL